MSKVSSPPLLSLQAVSKRFGQRAGGAAWLARRMGLGTRASAVHAVDQVSLTVHAGEVVGLVGESGCGKSTLGRMAAGLHTLSEGQRFWKGQNVDQLRQSLPAREFRKQMLSVQMIFQDPSASLNPRMTVLDLIGEAPVVHGLVPKTQQAAFVATLMNQVGLDPQAMKRHPHEFSVGQRARIGIARGLAVNPEFLVCDEAIASLDVSIQAQVINLFLKLRTDLNLTYLFISHDLSVIHHLCDRVVVMYLGRVVESGPRETVFAQSQHPYTQGLLADAPSLDVHKKTYAAIQGEIPSPLHPPSGCHFHPRCPHAMERCRQEAPSLTPRGPGHWVACHWSASH